MERTGVTPPGAVTAPDLAKILSADGPFVTACLTTESDIENAAQRSEQRWKTLRRELADQGAPEEVLAEIDGLVPDAHLQGQMLAVVANRSGVLHVGHGPEVPPRDIGQVGAVPPLAPILAVRQGSPAHVTVLADRAGADICVYRADGRRIEREAGGSTDPLARSKPGGWSQLRYQHRAENTWEHNADDVAEEIVDRRRPLRPSPHRRRRRRAGRAADP